MTRILFLILCSLLLMAGCKTTQQSQTSKTNKAIEEIQKIAIEKLYGKDAMPSFLNPDTLKKSFQNIDQWFKEVQGKEFMTEKDSKEILKQISQINPPTKYQDIGTYFLLKNLIEKVKITNSKIQLYKDTINPKFATIWTNEINAESRKVNNEYVLFFNKRLFDFCLTMSKLGSKPVEFRHEKNNQMSLSIDIDTLFLRISNDIALQERFIYALLEFHYDVAPDPFLLDDDHNSMVISLINSMELFVISHEYTHAALKHDLKEKYIASGETFSTKEDSIKLKKRLVESWENEVLADIYGQTIINSHSNIENNYYRKDFDKVGGFFFLQCLNILDESLYILQNKAEQPKYSKTDSLTENEILSNLFANKDSVKINYDNISDSWLSKLHPPFEIRQAFIMSVLDKRIKKEIQVGNLTQEQYAFYNLGINMTLTIEKLYELTKDKLIYLSNNQELLKQIKNEK